MTKHIVFERNGYEPFFDYLKGVCILLVILNHCIPNYLYDYSLCPLWEAQAVPLFLLLQVFHFYKIDEKKTNWKKIYHRVVKWFIIIEFFLIVFNITCLSLSVSTFNNFEELMSEFFSRGGFGMGSYYIWIYVQFAILLPLFKKHLRKNAKLMGGGIILLCVLLDLLSSYFISNDMYRLLFFRYTFLIYVGYIIVNKGIIINTKNTVYSLFGAVSLIVFWYLHLDFEPFVKNYWQTHRWMCSFYAGNLLLFLFYLTYRKTNTKVKNAFMKLGVYSYEIFLFQMIYFSMLNINGVSDFIHSRRTAELLFMLTSLIFCTTPVIIYKNIVNKNN